jgi:hypothetical protein
MDKDEALKLALEALERATRYGAGGFEDAKDSIKQALAAPVQEPVDSVQAIGNLMFALTKWKATTSKTAPAAWKKLLHACADMVATEQTAPVREPEYWNVIDPAGNIVASETDAIRGWARIAGSYKPTVEGLLGFHDQGWRVLPKVTLPAAQPAVPDAMTSADIQEHIEYVAGWNDCRQAMLEMMK